ncbi:MAG TPA: hypothetical protein VEY30_11895 [Myxococcaceae bacterium]|nr:hypothetical protein [Myxococcaceae bacterium]
MDKAKEEWVSAVLAFVDASLEATRARLLAAGCSVRSDPSTADVRRHALLVEMVRDQREELMRRAWERWRTLKKP